MAQQFCVHCKDGIACRNCGAPLMPQKQRITKEDYELILALLSSRLETNRQGVQSEAITTVATMYNITHESATAKMVTLRKKLRRLLDIAEKGISPLQNGDVQNVRDPQIQRELIMSRARAGEISYEQAIEMVEKL